MLVHIDGGVKVYALDAALAEGLVIERAAKRDACLDESRDVKHLAQRGGKRLRAGCRVAEREGRFLPVPGSPAVDVGCRAVPRVAAHPVDVGKHVGVLCLPVNQVGNLLPEIALALRVGDVVESLVVGVELYHARAAAKGAAHLANDAVIVHRLGNGAVGAEYHAVGHQRVDGADRRVLHEVLVNEAVAVGNPLLAVVAHANLSEVAFLTPYGIGDVEPEGRSPGTHSRVVEDVGTGLAHLVLDGDDGLAVLDAGVGEVGPYCRSLRADAVKLEEAEVVLLYHVLAAVDKVVVVRLVAQLHAAAVVPVLAAVVAACAVTSHRTEPCADAAAHLLREVVYRGEAVGEVAVESPGAVSVPAVVPYVSHGGLAVNVVELGLPLVQHVNALVDVHVGRVVALRVVGVGGIVVAAVAHSVVAVNVQLIPGDINRHCTPGHCTLALAVGEERTALLSLCHQTYDGAYVPVLVRGKGCGAVPVALDGYFRRSNHVQRVHNGVRHAYLARGGKLVRLFGNKQTQLVVALCGDEERVGGVRFLVAGVAEVVLAHSHVAVGVDEVNAYHVQAVVAALVGEVRHKRTLACLEAHGDELLVDVGVVVVELGHAVGDFVLRSLCPGGGVPSTVNRLVGLKRRDFLVAVGIRGSGAELSHSGEDCTVLRRVYHYLDVAARHRRGQGNPLLVERVRHSAAHLLRKVVGVVARPHLVLLDVAVYVYGCLARGKAEVSYFLRFLHVHHKPVGHVLVGAG